MRHRGVEIAVGLFVLAGLIALGYLSIRLGGVDFFDTANYAVTARFTSVSGLTEGASVEMAGVRIGKVQRIGLRDDEAVVTLRIDNGIKLTRDTIASIRTKGLLGEKYILISPGGAEQAILPGGRIRETEPPIDIEKLIGNFIFEKVK